MNDAALLGYQIGYEQRSFWRNPFNAGFGVAFPVVLLIIFATLNNGSTVNIGGKMPYSQYYTPAIVAEGIMGICFTGLVTTVSLRRDSGQLKVIRGTPLPPWIYLGGLLGNAAVVSLLVTLVVTLIGVVLYGVTVPDRYAALAVTVIIGAAAFCALALAATTLIPNADAAPAIANLVFFPIVALSGAFFPVPSTSALSSVANVLPLRRFILAVFACFDTNTGGTGFQGADLLIIGAWGVGGLIVALRRFRWEPSVR
jgi:ABC-2 type transport system permease protein